MSKERTHQPLGITQDIREAEQLRLDARIAKRERDREEIDALPEQRKPTYKRWGRTVAIWSFNTTTTALEAEYDSPIPMIESVEIAGDIYTGDKWTLTVGHRELKHQTGTTKWPIMAENVKRIIFTPVFGGARIGLLRFIYYGADGAIESKTTGNSAQLSDSLRQP